MDITYELVKVRRGRWTWNVSNGLIRSSGFNPTRRGAQRRIRWHIETMRQARG